MAQTGKAQLNYCVTLICILIKLPLNDANHLSRCGRTISCSGTRLTTEASACSVFPQTKSGSPISCSSTSKLICLDLPILNSFRHLLFGFSFSADGNYEVRYKSNVLIYPDGEVLWVPPAIYQVRDIISMFRIIIVVPLQYWQAPFVHSAICWSIALI